MGIAMLRSMTARIIFESAGPFVKFKEPVQS
jgi:hypothetical protein